MSGCFSQEEIQEYIKTGELKEVDVCGDGCSDKTGKTCFLFPVACDSYDCTGGKILIESE